MSSPLRVATRYLAEYEGGLCLVLRAPSSVQAVILARTMATRWPVKHLVKRIAVEDGARFRVVWPVAERVGAGV